MGTITRTLANNLTTGLGAGEANDFKLIKTVTISSATAYADFIHGSSDVVFDSTYKRYKVIISNFNLSAVNVWGIRWMESGSVVSSSDYIVAGHGIEDSNSQFTTSNSSGMDYGRLGTRNTANNSVQNEVIEILLDDPTLSRYKTAICSNGGMTGNGVAGVYQCVAVLKRTQTANGFRIMPSAGNIDTAIISLYGLKS